MLWWGTVDQFEEDGGILVREFGPVTLRGSHTHYRVNCCHRRGLWNLKIVRIVTAARLRSHRPQFLHHIYRTQHRGSFGWGAARRAFFFDFDFRNIFSSSYNTIWKWKNISKLEIEKKSGNFRNMKTKTFPGFYQIFWKYFLIFFSAKVAHDNASSLYPISRDEFRMTATLSKNLCLNLTSALHPHISPTNSVGRPTWWTTVAWDLCKKHAWGLSWRSGRRTRCLDEF